MGNAYHALSIYDQAVRYHRQELQISLEVNSCTLHKNMQTLMWETELQNLFVLQVNDRPSQASTHGNLAVAYQALGAHDRALQHYLHHLTIARELRDTQSEARALGKPLRMKECEVQLIESVMCSSLVLLQRTWATSIVGEVNSLKPCRTTSSTSLCPPACRTWREKARSATTLATLTTALDSIETLSGQT